MSTIIPDPLFGARTAAGVSAGLRRLARDLSADPLKEDLGVITGTTTVGSVSKVYRVDASGAFTITLSADSSNPYAEIQFIMGTAGGTVSISNGSEIIATMSQIGDEISVLLDGGVWSVASPAGDESSGQASFSIVDYGAVPGVGTDSTAAIQAAVNAAAAVGGVVFVPVGNFAFTSITLSAASGVTFRGESTTNQVSGGSLLTCTGTAAVAISVASCGSFSVENLGLRYSNASFSGTLLRAALCSDVHFNEVTAMGLSASVDGAEYLIDIDTSTDVSFRDVSLDFAQYGILGQAVDGGGYSNAVKMSGVRFGSGMTAGDIRNPGQAWEISCDFENLADGTGKAIKCDAAIASGSSPPSGVVISGSWLGDATAAGAWSWIEVCGRAWSIHGNFISGTGNVQSTAIEVVAATVGLEVSANQISDHLNGVDLGSGLVSDYVIGPNQWNNTTNRITGSSAGHGLTIGVHSTILMEMWAGGNRTAYFQTDGTANLNGGQVRQKHAVISAPSGTTFTADWSGGNHQEVDLGSASGNLTATFSNGLSGATYTLAVIQSATARTITWPGTVLWPGGTPPTLSTGNDDVDEFRFYFDGTNYRGSVVGQAYA